MGQESSKKEPKSTGKEPKPTKEEFMDAIGKVLDDFGIKTAIIVTDTTKPFYRGDFYTIAKTVTAVYKDFRSEVIADIMDFS